jgi:vacuolar-type H+-ATPase subunit E/Vma4
MEELQSSELLDREILEDARRKAQRALRNADEAVSRSKANWEKKTAADIAALRGLYTQRLAANRAELEARLPLDKKRCRLALVDRLLSGAKDSYLKSLDKGRSLKLLGARLAACISEAGLNREGKGDIEGRGLSASELKALFKPLISQVPQKLAFHSLPSPAGQEAVVFDSPQARLRASTSGILDELLDYNRAELCHALLPDELLVGE